MVMVLHCETVGYCSCSHHFETGRFCSYQQTFEDIKRFGLYLTVSVCAKGSDGPTQVDGWRWAEMARWVGGWVGRQVNR